MRLSLVCLSVCLAAATGRREILRKHGDTFLRLQNHGGNLVMDEGDIVPVENPLQPPNNYRYKRIAQVKDYQTFLKDQDKYEYLQNNVNTGINKMDVNVDALEKVDLFPASSQRDFVGINGMLETNSLAPQQDGLYERDTAHCLQKYLCEISATSKQNLLMEESALLAMVQSQTAELRAGLQASLTPDQGIRRLRRSATRIDAALKEAAQVEKFCSKQFPLCKISRIDILQVYKEQKESFCSLPMPYGM